MKEPLSIRLYGDAVLKEKSRSVKHITDRHRGLFSGMARLMYAESGIGLAAPQVGINEALIVVDIGTGLYKLLNPSIVQKEGVQALEEGCLSIPGICVKVRRSRKITVHAQDPDGQPVVIHAEDLLACVLQHEIDHLYGRLIVDYMPYLGRLRMKKTLNQLRKKARDEGVPESRKQSCQLQL